MLIILAACNRPILTYRLKLASVPSDTYIRIVRYASAEMVSRVAEVPSARAEVMATVASLTINRNSRLSLIGG